MSYRKSPYYKSEECKKKRQEYYRNRKASWVALPPDTERECKECGRILLIENFKRQPMGADGYAQRCKECSKPFDSKYNDRWIKCNWQSVLVKNLRARQAKAKRIKEVTITREDICRMWDEQGGRCYWFNVPMLTPPGNYRKPAQLTVDRLDNSRGYTRDNVVLACYAANAGRSITSKEDFRAFCDLITSQTR